MLTRHQLLDQSRRSRGMVCPDARLKLIQSRGFTLIELLAVIVVISILIALLLPAISTVRKRATVAQVKTEISAIEAACTAFKGEYDVYPPSRILIPETATGWNSNTPDIRESKAFIRQCWPQFDFNYGTAGQIDINDDGSFTTLVLTNGECLAFFLGGLHNKTIEGSTTLWTSIGFSKDPAAPFKRGTGPRTAPFYDHPVSRYSDIDNDNNPEFLDPISGQQTPYFYAAAGTGGYTMGCYNNSGNDLPVVPYSQDNLNKTPWNAKGIQIISPGYDFRLGPGGPFKPDSGTPFPAYTAADKPNASWTNLTTDVSIADRDGEYDNISNFSSGTMGGR